MAAEGEIGIDSMFESTKAESLEPAHLGDQSSLIAEIAVGKSVPEIQGGVELFPRRPGIVGQATASLGDEGLEFEHVEGGGLDCDAVSVAMSNESISKFSPKV
jgi:hypothetical protein